MVYPITPEDRKLLEEMGEAYVREVSGAEGFPHPSSISALAWLAELDEAQRVSSETLQANQTQQFRSTLKAWIVAYTAFGVFLIGIIAIIIGVLGWLYGHH